ARLAAAASSRAMARNASWRRSRASVMDGRRSGAHRGKLRDEKRPRAMQARANSADRALQDCRGGGVVEVVQLAEHDRFAINRRQRCDRGADALRGLGAAQVVKRAVSWGLEAGGRVDVLVERRAGSERGDALQDLTARDAEQIGADGTARRVVLLQLPEQGEK